MKTGVVIQARMSSRRLPGKVLMPMAGRPMLEHLIERLKHLIAPAEILVATSVEEFDQPIVALCDVNCVACIRGDLKNVASRFRDVFGTFDFDAIVRVSGDSPLLDQRIVDDALDSLGSSDADMVTNVHPRTFPSGQSVEAFRAAAFERAYAMMSEPGDFEHVTPVFYRETDRFNIMNRTIDGESLNHVRLSVDTQEQFDLAEAIIESMEREPWTYGVTEIVNLYHSVKDKGH